MKCSVVNVAGYVVVVVVVERVVLILCGCYVEGVEPSHINKGCLTLLCHLNTIHPI